MDVPEEAVGTVIEAANVFIPTDPKTKTGALLVYIFLGLVFLALVYYLFF